MRVVSPSQESFCEQFTKLNGVQQARLPLSLKSMCFSPRKATIGLLGNWPVERYQSLLDACGYLYPVVFRQVQEGDYDGLDALISLEGSLAAVASSGLPSYVVMEGNTTPVIPSRMEVRFSKSAILDERLRGQVMQNGHPEPLCPLTPGQEDEVLACKGEHPVWLDRSAGRGLCQLVAFSPPAIQPGDFLFRHLNGPGFMRLLPLLHFLRHLVKDVNWLDSPSRACFVFDDPSLYRPTYGFLDYQLLARHATQHNYYVSVAMVPLDTWWVNRSVAEIFRSFNPRLSLLVHGNNHTSHELLRQNKGFSQLASMAQAMRRMNRMESQHQIPFIRIVEPPHAVIGYEMFEHLLALGYEAALSTTDRLVQKNSHVSWPVAAGMDRTELLGGGLPIIPRIRMSSNWKNEVLMAAWLRQPIILAGHQLDARENLELLASFAGVVNQFKDVTWSSPLEIARSNYKLIRQGDTLHVKAYSRRFQVFLPEGVKYLCVLRPWLRDRAADESLIINSSGRKIFCGVGPGVLGPIPVASPGMIEVCSPWAKMIDYRTVEIPKPSCWPVVRKILMEVRDRSAPWRYRAKGLFRQPSRNSNAGGE